ncbi:hypothetical protein X777_01901 [Ooceraea biroi]|uniref:Uncharacterized protein n=1 Tax=Ooceraea biroi TaxID=2015173 RepID=A0A026WQ56_OOCBI|nr:hypothetical protein X777_01901 [Ooceraea biroi]
MCESGGCTIGRRATGIIERTVSIYGRSGAIITYHGPCKYTHENMLLSILSRADSDRLPPVCALIPSLSVCQKSNLSVQNALEPDNRCGVSFFFHRFFSHFG